MTTLEVIFLVERRLRTRTATAHRRPVVGERNTDRAVAIAITARPALGAG
ncbi:hypothetical protein [Nonomuraea sp. NPDC048901]